VNIQNQQHKKILDNFLNDDSVKNLSKRRLNEYLNKLAKNEDITDFLFETPTDKEEALRWTYHFWKDQPVIQINEIASIPQIIDRKLASKIDLEKETVMLKPYEWHIYDKTNINDDLDIIVDFFNKNYYSGPRYESPEDKNKFNQFYTKKYLSWLLGINYIILSIKFGTKIGGVMCIKIKKMQLFDIEKNVGDIVMFCIHPKLREEKLYNLFAKEATRLLCKDNINIGTFLTTKYIPTPVCKVEFYHRPINYRKLQKAGFVHLKNAGDAHELNVAIDEFKVSNQSPRGIKMTTQHIQEAYDILEKYSEKYNICERYSLESFIQTFMDDSVVGSYVILDDDGRVQDFYSFYKIVLKKKTPETININDLVKMARMHTYTSTIITPLTIFKSAIISASIENMDVFTCTDVMENLEILYDNFNKFSKGLSYKWINFYNWECPNISTEQICMPIF
jgi:glycylpeptide N-tetradecanoyltransferase